MDFKNKVIRAISVIGILTLVTLTILPGCNFIGQAEPEEGTTTTSGDITDVNGGDTFEQCCPICSSTDIAGPDAEGYYVCNACGQKWTQDDTTVDIIGDDGSVVTQLDASATTKPIVVGPSGNGGSSSNNGGSSSGNGGSSSGNGGSSSGNGGSSSTPTFTTTTTTTKSVQQQLDEIKDRWGDVIKPTIDADGNITVESVDGSDTGLFGYNYSTKDKCFIIAEDAWQRNFGYNEVYDASSSAIMITYDTMRVYFEHEGLEWMIQYWKGQYGMVLVGAEIGTYNRPAGSSMSTHYDCATDDLKMLQSMDVYRRESTGSNKFKYLFSRSPAFTWWCAGFVPGTLGAGKYNVTAEETAMLKVDSKLTLHSPEMAQAFMQGLREVKTVEYNGLSKTKRTITMKEYATVAEYESATGVAHKFCLEEDGVTVRVCWR
ncbi:MAG: DUF4474 domain-containing protein [Clostridia bacterium]|nr:DUF4474 domain-containing protein [Clostridia bacterium]